MIINKTAWHYRWYNYWLTHGRGVKLGYKENLCHYVRVLLFWAPMTWLDRTWNLGMVAKRGLVGAWILSMIVPVGVLVVIAAITNTYGFLIAIGSLTGLLLAAGSWILYVRLGGLHATLHLIDITGTSRIVGNYVLTKKRRICPFLTFEDTTR